MRGLVSCSRTSPSTCPCSADLRNFFFFNDTATTEIYPLSLHDVFRSNSAGLNDGATGCILADEDTARELGLPAAMRLGGYSFVGGGAGGMGIGTGAGT